ncbi:unnamed protein product [Victoria cruziana]
MHREVVALFFEPSTSTFFIGEGSPHVFQSNTWTQSDYYYRANILVLKMAERTALLDNSIIVPFTLLPKLLLVIVVDVEFPSFHIKWHIIKLETLDMYKSLCYYDSTIQILLLKFLFHPWLQTYHDIK